ncbi:peptidase M50 [Fluviibacterium sp. DFM31]|uniref:Peptidase M50 n=1 Tax=Meridianimarinicoccus marinus TaxID=3231483 RepID=A0ABV3L3L9_9RHOB
MAKTFLSAHWYRVADLAPRLKAQAEMHRQRFRGQTWHILQDHQSGKFFRVSPAANLMICLMDGRRSMQDLWLNACERFPDNPPTQDEAIRLLSQLHQADLLLTGTAPDFVEIERRAVKQETRALLQRIRNPLALRFPLLDPDRLLTTLLPLVRWLFSPFGALLWLALVGTGATLAVMNFDLLAANVADRVLATENLLLLALVYPAVKALHELGHGFATKAAGGEVHEMGIMFLVLMPIPYVDASAASAFATKWHRALVGAAGIFVELALASAAMIFWIYAEPGLARAIAFNVMLIGGVSTLLFNGNPLLRFDGYYVLADLVEIPNLGQRSNRYFTYLIQTRLFNMEEVESPVTAPGERGWFLFYAIASFFYRVGISVSIALFIAQKFFFVGVLLAIWALSNMFVFPLVKGLWFVLTNRALHRQRKRAIAITAGVVLAVLAGVLTVPLPYATMAEGVALPPQGAVVRTGTEGFVLSVPEVAGSTRVETGTVLTRLAEPSLQARIAVLRAQEEEIVLRLASAVVIDRVQAGALRAQLSQIREVLASETRRAGDLVVVAPGPGLFLTRIDGNYVGRLAPKGADLGYLLGTERLVVRTVVPQTRVELVRQRNQGIALRYAGTPETVYRAVVVRGLSESRELPARALSPDGGGTLAVDPTDPEGKRLLIPAFQMDLVAEGEAVPPRVGERVWVRFDHGSEPIAPRLYRAVRQLFLSQFSV